MDFHPLLSRPQGQFIFTRHLFCLRQHTFPGISGRFRRFHLIWCQGVFNLISLIRHRCVFNLHGHEINESNLDSGLVRVHMMHSPRMGCEVSPDRGEFYFQRKQICFFTFQGTNSNIPLVQEEKPMSSQLEGEFLVLLIAIVQQQGCYPPHWPPWPESTYPARPELIKLPRKKQNPVTLPETNVASETLGVGSQTFPFGFPPPERMMLGSHAFVYKNLTIRRPCRRV